MDKQKLKHLLVRKQREIEMSVFDSLMDAYLDAIVDCTTRGVTRFATPGSEASSETAFLERYNNVYCS